MGPNVGLKADLAKSKPPLALDGWRNAGEVAPKIESNPVPYPEKADSQDDKEPETILFGVGHWVQKEEKEQKGLKMGKNQKNSPKVSEI